VGRVWKLGGDGKKPQAEGVGRPHHPGEDGHRSFARRQIT
jgi:hypothetical protein